MLNVVGQSTTTNYGNNCANERGKITVKCFNCQKMEHYSKH